jgi:hypothetical protein
VTKVEGKLRAWTVVLFSCASTPGEGRIEFGSLLRVYLALFVKRPASFIHLPSGVSLLLAVLSQLHPYQDTGQDRISVGLPTIRPNRVLFCWEE